MVAGGILAAGRHWAGGGWETDIMLDNLMLLGAAPVLNLQLVLDGIFIGAIFALAAYGLALVWGVMNVKNLAQGDFVIIGGYIAWWLSIDVHMWSIVLSLIYQRFERY